MQIAPTSGKTTKIYNQKKTVLNIERFLNILINLNYKVETCFVNLEIIFPALFL